MADKHFIGTVDTHDTLRQQLAGAYESTAAHLLELAAALRGDPGARPPIRGEADAATQGALRQLAKLPWWKRKRADWHVHIIVLAEEGEGRTDA